jgi:DNA-binding MarR family transcriptional regulator
MPSTQQASSAAAARRADHGELLQQAVRQMLVMKRVFNLALKRVSAGKEAETVRKGEGQYHTLHALAHEQRLMAGELAQRCHVSEPTISKSLKSLEHGGLIQRQTDPDNRRVVWVSLTPAGRAMHDKMEAYFEGKMAEVLAPLSENQLRDLIVAFGHLEHLVGPADADSRAESDVTHSMSMHEEGVVSGIE